MWTALKTLLAKSASLLGMSIPLQAEVAKESTTQALRSARLQGHLRALQLKSLLDNLGTSLMSTIAVAALATWALWPYIGEVALLSWFATVMVSVGVRLWHRRYLQHELVEDSRWLSDQLNWIRIGCLVNGILWGVLSTAFYPEHQPMAQGLLIFIITGVSAAAVAVLAADQLCALAVVLPAVAPLSVRLIVQPEDVGRAIGVISLAYLIVITGAVRRAHAYIFGHIQLSLQALEREQHLRISQDQLTRQHELSTAVARAQDRFIRDSDPLAVFADLLRDTLALTQSDYGLIAEWRDHTNHEEDLKAIAVLDRSWDEATCAKYRARISAGLQLKDSRVLFASALSSGTPVVLNNLTLVASRTGLPGGQATLRNLVAVPLSISGQRLGLVVIANRNNGYDQQLMDFLQPLLATIAQILLAVHGDQQRRSAENTVIESAERTRAVIDNVVDGIILTDAAGFIVEFNRAAERIYGYEAAEVIGRTMQVLMAHSESSYAEVVAACLAEDGAHHGSSVVRELAGLRKSGERFELELSVTPTPLSGQTMFTAVVRDITQQKRTHLALVEASEAAAAANRAKSEFLANMSHEIRTPMNGVLGMTELLLETTLDQVQRDYTDTIRDSAKSLLTVVNDILDYSKVEAGKLELEKIDMDLRDVVEDVARLIAMQGHSKGLEVSAHVDPSLPDNVVGDPGRVRQVLLNLGSNAVKFTEQGEVRLNLTVVSTDSKQFEVRCEVCDSGIGIPPQRLDMLFRPFTQVDSSMTRRFGGTGLGLSIVRSLVELMGGKVGVESKVGTGSTFWFTARFDVGVQQGNAAAQKVSPSGKRVLIVDDNATNRRVLSVQVRRCGLQPVDVSSAAEALNTLESAHTAGQSFDIALIDQQMPGFDGAKLGAIVSTDARYKSMRLVLLTSMGRRGDARRFSDLGFAAYLLKPTTQRDLADCLSMLANDERGSVSAPIITRHQLRANRAREQRQLLLVDDNPVNQKVGKALLERIGYRVDLAANGIEALAAWERTRYDAILMDCQMPEMDGYQATREIRRREQGLRRIPIVAVTAHAMAGAEEECIAAGMDAYQSKPLDRELLSQCLNRLFDEEVAEGAVVKPAVEITAPPSTEPVDWRKIDEATGGDNQFALELINTFAGSSKLSLTQIEAALASQDLPAVQRAAHSLKGAAGSLGATTARLLAANLEAAAKSGNRSEAALIFEALRLEVARANDYMHDKVDAA
jgi:PAS domain S-box-containing protein